MPNWCSNSIEIVGPRDKIRALWEAAQQDEQAGGGLLQAMHPMPKFETDGDDTMPNWWNWRVENWGTKWEISTEGLEYEQDEDGNFENETGQPYARITGWFDSAWAPPTGACQAYGEANPDVRITLDYHEPGMCFVGRFLVEEGSADDEYYEYSDATSTTVRDMIGDDMDDMWNISEDMAQWEEENDDA